MLLSSLRSVQLDSEEDQCQAVTPEPPTLDNYLYYRTVKVRYPNLSKAYNHLIHN